MSTFAPQHHQRHGGGAPLLEAQTPTAACVHQGVGVWRKGQSQLYSLRKRSAEEAALRRGTTQLDKLVRKAGSVVGAEPESLTSLAEKRTFSKLPSIVHHPMHNTITRWRGTYSNLSSMSCSKETLRNRLSLGQSSTPPGAQDLLLMDILSAAGQQLLDLQHLSVYSHCISCRVRDLRAGLGNPNLSSPVLAKNIAWHLGFSPCIFASDTSGSTGLTVGFNAVITKHCAALQARHVVAAAVWNAGPQL